jgi:integrase
VRAKITKRIVDAVQPSMAEQIVWDTELKGFGLRVTPAGGKTYFVYYRTTSGQQRKPTIGAHGEITADQARAIAKDWLAKAVVGEDVSGDRQAARKAETVEELATRYLTEYAEVHKKPRSVATDRSNIDNHVLPLLGKLKIKDVTIADIERFKFAIRDGKTARKLEAKPRGRRIVRGGKGIANRVLALLSKMFACAELWGLCDANPARRSKKFREERKDRFLDSDELRNLHKAFDAAEKNQTESEYALAALRLLLYTGMRLGEVIELRWRNVDCGEKCLRLSDSKTGKRIVPLNSVAFEILDRMTKGEPDDLVIQSSQLDRPIALTRPWYRLRSAAKIDRTANIHCLRHTFASWSVMNGLSLPQVGAVLGHKSAQTTLRYADHLQDAVRSYSENTASAILAFNGSKERPTRSRTVRSTFKKKQASG